MKSKSPRSELKAATTIASSFPKLSPEWSFSVRINDLRFLHHMGTAGRCAMPRGGKGRGAQNNMYGQCRDEAVLRFRKSYPLLMTSGRTNSTSGMTAGGSRALGFSFLFFFSGVSLLFFSWATYITGGGTLASAVSARRRKVVSALNNFKSFNTTESKSPELLQVSCKPSIKQRHTLCILRLGKSSSFTWRRINA